MSGFERMLSLGDIIHEGIENGVETKYTVADVLMGCRKVLTEASKSNECGKANDVEDRITYVFDQLTDILVCAGLVKEGKDE